MFQNPMSKPSYQISRKPIISQKVLVTQSSNIVHCDWHYPEIYMCRLSSLSKHLSLHKLTFFHFFVGGVKWPSQKFHILLILTGKNTSKWLEWHVFRIWDVPNLMALVSSLYNKQLLKNQNFRKKFHNLLILTGKNTSYWLEWYVFRVLRSAKSNGTCFKSLQ